MKIKGDEQGKALLFKIITVGESNIGKTCLIERYISDSFLGNYIATIGMDIRLKRLEINNCDVGVTIIDTAGQERFRSLTKMVYKGADGILIGFDLTDRYTFEQVNYWLDQIEANKSKDYPTSLVLVGNKYDRKEDIIVKDDDVQSIKEKYNIEYFPTSAKDGINVQNAFEYLIKNIIISRGLLEKICLSSDTSIDDIVIKVKDNQNKEKKIYKKKRKKKKNFC